MTHTYIFEGTMTALTSISHIGDTFGINAKLRREKVIQLDGSVEEIPIISGNSLRGILRDRGMLHMLRALGYGIDEDNGEVRGLSLAAFYFLFSGGALTKDKTRGLDIETARRWRELIPLVSLFGGAMGNQIMPGKVKIGKAIPICEETAHLIPERFIEHAPPIWDMLQEEAYTRRDDEKNEKLRALLAPQVRYLMDAYHQAQFRKAGSAEDVAQDTGQKQQMRYYVETIAPGAVLFWDVTLDDVTKLEFEAFAATLGEFAKFPYIGGKSSVGLGKVAISFDKWIEIEPRIAPQGRELDFALGNLYHNHLHEHAGEIMELLNELS